MGQLRQAGDDVSDGEDAWLSCLLRGVHLHEAAFELDAGLLDSDVGGSPGAAHGDQHLFGLLHLGLAVGVGEGDPDAGFGLFDLLHFGACVDVDTTLFEEARDLLGDLLVLDRNHARQKLKEGDLRAEGAEEGAELHADRACSDDDQRLGHLVDGQHFNVGKDAAAGSEAGKHLGLGAGGENHVFRLHLACFAGPGRHLDGVHAVLGRAGEAAIALDARDLVLFHQKIEALGVLGDDAVFALEHRGPVERGRTDAFDAEVGGVLEMVPYLGIEEQSLGGNAADVQAGAPQLAGLLDQGDFQSVFRAANGRRIAGRPAADDCCIVDCLCHFFSQGELHSGVLPSDRAATIPPFSLMDAA